MIIIFSSCFRFIDPIVKGFVLDFWNEKAIVILMARRKTHKRKDVGKYEMQEELDISIPIYRVLFKDLSLYSWKAFNVDYVDRISNNFFSYLSLLII